MTGFGVRNASSRGNPHVAAPDSTTNIVSSVRMGSCAAWVGPRANPNQTIYTKFKRTLILRGQEQVVSRFLVKQAFLPVYPAGRDACVTLCVNFFIDLCIASETKAVFNGRLFS